MMESSSSTSGPLRRPPTSAAAREALAAADATQAAVGRELVLPRGLDWQYGIGLAFAVGGSGAGGAWDSSLATKIGTPLLFGVSAAILWNAMVRFRRANGLWFTSLNGPRRASAIWFTFSVLMGVVAGAAAYVTASGGTWLPVLGLALVALGTGVAATRWWFATLRAGLAATGQRDAQPRTHQRG